MQTRKRKREVASQGNNEVTEGLHKEFLERVGAIPNYCGLEKRMKPETVSAKREGRIKHERVKVKTQKMLSKNLMENESSARKMSKWNCLEIEHSIFVEGLNLK